MAESVASGDAEATTPTLKLAKDKMCQYCGQAFTSSSLGRHLDLFIREKKPKEPDGIHDVDEIRKLRGKVTRRVTGRSSLAARDTPTPVGTPTTATASRKTPGSDAGALEDGTGEFAAVSGPYSPSSSRPATHVPAAGLRLRTPGWGSAAAAAKSPQPDGDDEAGGGDGKGEPAAAGGAVGSGPATKPMVTPLLGMRQKVQDAVDTSRAAELALRELLCSLRAAKTQIDMRTTPFDFDPLALDFPALTLQCLQPPPTLFSSTQHPTPTSWSITPAGPQQLQALRTFFAEEFRRWKAKCADAASALQDELRYPSGLQPSPADAARAALVRTKAEKAAESLGQQVAEHLESSYVVWEGLSEPRRTELWTLELARGLGRRRKEVEQLKEERHTLKQEIASLKFQLTGQNQPREFKMTAPATFPISESLADMMVEQSLGVGRCPFGDAAGEQHEDMGRVVAKCIKRWKAVVLGARLAASTRMQLPVDQSGSHVSADNVVCAPPASAPLPTTTPAVVVPEQPAASPIPRATARKKPQPRSQPQPHQAGKKSTTTTTTLPPQEAKVQDVTVLQPPPPSPPPLPPVADETSDLDADAEMEDDDGYAAMNVLPPLAAETPALAPPSPLPPQPPPPSAAPVPARTLLSPRLDVRRTRGPAQRAAAASSMHGASRSASVSHTAATARRGSQLVGGGGGVHRSVTNFSPAALQQQKQSRERALQGYIAAQPPPEMGEGSVLEDEADQMFMD